VRAAPKKPDVAWEAGNFLLLRGERDAAMREFRVVLENDDIAAPAVLDLIWRVEPDAQALLDQVIPARPETYGAFLAHLIYKKDNDAAAKAWSALIGLQQPFSQRTGWATSNTYWVSEWPIRRGTRGRRWRRCAG